MDTHTHITECPVATLAHEAMALIEAHKRLDRMSLEATGQRRADLERCMDAVEDSLNHIGMSATYLRACSGIGIMFQLHQIASCVDKIISAAGDEDRQEHTRAAAEAAINRMLYRIRDEVERLTGDNADDACGEYFMPRHLSQLDLAEKALDMEEFKQ